jgi:predicted HTH domain antitoxin
MRSLVRDGVNGATPPYGYILAAATNISKSAYDAFREELRKKGVTEFYFWGKDYLEDQLALLSRLSWKWKGRSTVKIAERAREETTKALQRRREGRHFEAALAGTGAGFQAL